MATNYFKNFPLVQYNNLSVRNIILKAKVAKEIINSFDNFYPYTIKPGETPTSLAFDYYGSVEYVWLIFVANNIVDPYYDWPLEDSAFEEFIIKKYGSQAAALNINNANYYRSPNFSYWMTKTTYDNISPSERSTWVPVSNYDYESYKNNDKRQIKLIDRSLAADLSFEMERLLKRVNRA